jgi:threonylcarbamoyladenosine tRNA methylthiotransferase MtaB
LLSLSEEKRLKFYQSQIGKTLSILWEESKKGDKMHGFSENYIVVEIPNDPNLVNQITQVTPTQFNADKSALTM